MGDAVEGPQRDFAGALGNGCGASRGDRPGLREEDREDAEARDRGGPGSREIRSVMEARQWRA